jgi:1,4-alpha-glucan branching enzyme
MPALHEVEYSSDGFRWLDWNDRDSSVLAWVRFSASGQAVISVSNFTPVVREGYRLGVPNAGRYVEIMNTDRQDYGGGGVVNAGGLETSAEGYQDLPASILVTLPPLATIYLALERG